MSKTKKILFLITQSEMGGAQRFVETVVTHLDSSKYELLVAAGPNKKRVQGTGYRVQPKPTDEYPLLDSLEKYGIKVARLKHLQREIRPIQDLRACLELSRLIKTFKPDALFLNSSKAGFIGSLVSRCTLYPVPCTLIYRIGGWSFNDPWPQWKKKFWIWIEKLSARWKDIIIVNNQHDLDQAKSLHIKPRQSLELIHNGLDLANLHLLPRDEAREVYGSSTSIMVEARSGLLYPVPCTLYPEFWIGTIANFYPPKGLEYLIEAVRLLNSKFQISNFKLVIIGDGELRQDLETKIADLGLKNQIILAGQKNEAYQYLKAFDVYVQPSVKEGFPWAVLEAMAAGLPVIATSVGAIQEIIQNGQNGLIVPPRDPETLALAINSLLSNDSLRLTLGTAATQTVSENFSLSQMLQKIEALL